MINYGLMNTAAQASTSGGTGEKIWPAIIAAGAQIVGGLINARGARQANQMTQQDNRETLEQQRLMQREELRARMQADQDEYQRTIMRNRRAIAPYSQMYSGPRFEGVDPNAPIYNPLMEQGSMFQQLGEAPTGPWTPQQQRPRGG